MFFKKLKLEKKAEKIKDTILDCELFKDSDSFEDDFGTLLSVEKDGIHYIDITITHPKYGKVFIMKDSKYIKVFRDGNWTNYFMRIAESFYKKRKNEELLSWEPLPEEEE